MTRRTWLAVLVAISVGPVALRADQGPGSFVSVNNITHEERDLLLVVDLSEYAPAHLRHFFEWTESLAVRYAYHVLKHRYHGVYLLAGKNASLERFAGALDALAARPGSRAIDVIVQLHGFPSAIAFHEGKQTLHTIAQRLAAGRADGKLRALYSGACYGASHAAAWIRGGFQAASGAVKVNANGLHDYPAFLSAWDAGETFRAAQEKGNNRLWRGISDIIAATFGYRDVDSRKEVFGQTWLTIRTAFERVPARPPSPIDETRVTAIDATPEPVSEAAILSLYPAPETVVRMAPAPAITVGDLAADNAGVTRLSDTLVKKLETR